MTNKVNSERSERATKTRCVRDHALTGENLIVRLRPGGLTRRECRTCANTLRRVSNRRSDVKAAERTEAATA